MPAQISLQLDKSVYRPGETVRGTVHLIAQQRSASAQCAAARLR